MMRARWMAVVALLAAVAVAAPACGGDDSTTTAEKSSGSRSTTTERASESDPSDSGSDSGSSDSSSDSGTSDTLPDMSDMGALGDCLQVASTWAGLALSALGSPEDAKKARDQAEELKSSLPADLHDDLDTVAEAYATVAEKGLIEGADALDTPEFNKANKNIEAYLDKTCSGPGN